ncbi:MAG: hypothetical protein OXH45_05415 [Gammaproteobacteria bacterium]|nr:hypothetical protein [Gammaproteobacteria bacterium]
MDSHSNKESPKADGGQVEGGGALTVEVAAPRFVETKKFTWPKALLVGDAADQAAKAFDYEAGDPTFMNKDRLVLQRDKTLIDSGVQDFDWLELTDKGGGV